MLPPCAPQQHPLLPPLTHLPAPLTYTSRWTWCRSPAPRSVSPHYFWRSIFLIHTRIKLLPGQNPSVSVHFSEDKGQRSPKIVLKATLPSPLHPTLSPQPPFLTVSLPRRPPVPPCHSLRPYCPPPQVLLPFPGGPVTGSPSAPSSGISFPRQCSLIALSGRTRGYRLLTHSLSDRLRCWWRKT